MSSKLISMNPRRYDTFLTSRPRACENQAIALIIKLARYVCAYYYHSYDCSVLYVCKHFTYSGCVCSLKTIMSKQSFIFIDFLHCYDSEFQVRCHVVHLSSSDAIEMVRQARAEGVRITVETTFHYLHFTAEQVICLWCECACACVFVCAICVGVCVWL